MLHVKLKVAAGHNHLFHRMAQTIATDKGYFEAENLVDIADARDQTDIVARDLVKP